MRFILNLTLPPAFVGLCARKLARVCVGGHVGSNYKVLLLTNEL